MLFENSIISTFLFLLAHHALAIPETSPQRVTFAALTEASSSPPILKDALTKDGFISVTDIPSFRQTKQKLMSQLHACMMELEAVPTQHLEDGTIRRSFATVTLPGVAGGPQPIQSLDAPKFKSGSCEHFESHVTSFRRAVALTTKRFAKRLSEEMNASLPEPLMTTAVEGHDYAAIQDVVAGGEHLEHFHSYQKGRKVDENEEDSKGNENETTIEFHTDQGFFIAFTPGLLVSDYDSSEKALELSDGFYVQDSNGGKFLVKFNEEDDLVFMMGDGVNQ